MKTKPIRGLAAAAVVLAVIGLVFSGVHTASMVQPQTDEIATVVAGTVEATISLKEIKIGIFVQQTLDAYYHGTPTPTPPARVENVETSIAGTLEAMQPTATYTDEDREIAMAVHETVMAILSFATPTPGELSPMRMTLAAMERMLTETASVGAPQPLANAPEAGQVWNYPVPSATPPAPPPDASQPLVLPGGSSESPAPPEEVVPPPDEGSPESPEPPVPPEEVVPPPDKGSPESPEPPVPPEEVVPPPDEESPEPPVPPEVLPPPPDGPPPPPPPDEESPESPESPPDASQPMNWPPPEPLPPDSWSVYIDFELNGGYWELGRESASSTMTRSLSEPIYIWAWWPVREGYVFGGWTIVLTDATNGNVVYDSGDEIWDVYRLTPLVYDPAKYPLQMNCMMTAQWNVGKPDVWTLNVSYDLQGGEFINYNGDPSFVIITPVGHDVDMYRAFKDVWWLKPARKNDRFLGWSVVLYDSYRFICYDGRGSIWNLMTPFAYDPDKPKEMDLVLVANWGSPIPEPTRNLWRVYIKFELDKDAVWGTRVDDYEIVAVIGQDMPYHAFDPIRTATVYKPGHKFDGWSVRCYDMSNNLLFDQRHRVWNLERSFDYDPKDPNEMVCYFKSRFSKISDPEKVGYWNVRFIYNLGHGKWKDGKPPSNILAPIWQDMPLTSIKKYVPVQDYAKFLGWSVRITDETSSKVIYDGGESIWDLDVPFIYYLENPESQVAWMTARWERVDEQQPMILKPSNPPAPPPDEEEPEPDEEEPELPPPPEPEIELDDFIIEFLDSGQGWGDFELPTAP